MLTLLLLLSLPGKPDLGSVHSSRAARGVQPFPARDGSATHMAVVEQVLVVVADSRAEQARTNSWTSQDDWPRDVHEYEHLEHLTHLTQPEGRGRPRETFLWDVLAEGLVCRSTK
jgi:hypothetical protein